MIGREYMKKRILEGKKLEWVGLILFAIAYAVISAFHEPWFDEAQAWQIAKCASLQEMLFEIPHYEGHPPLWHLILAIPAKLGVPFEIGLKTVGFLISTTSADTSFYILLLLPIWHHCSAIWTDAPYSPSVRNGVG